MGANSLLDIVVFGRACAITASEVRTLKFLCFFVVDVFLQRTKPNSPHKELKAGAGEASIANVDKLLTKKAKCFPPSAAFLIKFLCRERCGLQS